MAIAKRIGVDEKTVRTARKQSGSEYSDPGQKGLGADGKMYPTQLRKARKPAVKLFKARKIARWHKPPTNEKEQLIAFGSPDKRIGCDEAERSACPQECYGGRRT